MVEKDIEKIAKSAADSYMRSTGKGILDDPSAVIARAVAAAIAEYDRQTSN